MKKFFTNKTVLFLLGIVALILGWFLVSKMVDKNGVIFPGPFETILMVVDLLKKSSTYNAILFTFSRLILGFVLSLFIAFILGTIVNDNEKLYSFFQPIVTFFKSVPTGTIVFLFITLSGISGAPVLVVITVTFPILYEAIVGAYKNTDKAIIESTRVDGSSKLKTLLTIQLPIGLPTILVGLTSSFSLAFKVEIMSEILTGFTNGGLGSLIKGAQILNPVDLTMMFAYSFIAIVFILLITYLSNLVKGLISKRYKIAK